MFKAVQGFLHRLRKPTQINPDSNERRNGQAPQERDIILGVPGTWSDRSAIVSSITQANDQLIFAGMMLLDTKTGQSFQVDIYDHDPALGYAFALAGSQSLTDADIERINTHTYTLYLIGKEGSIERAQHMLQLSADLIRAGGLAVKVETTGIAHSARDWLTLANDQQPAALYQAYVTFVSGENSVYSCGMHNLGFPDAMVSSTVPASDAADLLETFLVYMLQEQPTFRTGETFSTAADMPSYTLQHVPCTLYPHDDPFYNPYGMWKLIK